MKKLLFALILSLLTLPLAYAQDYYEGKLISTDSLASILQHAPQSVHLLNTGPVQNIATAITIGAVEYQENLDKLATVIPSLDQAKPTIIYCGCCPLVVCPNLEPAVQLLEKQQFKVLILNLSEGIEEDWMSKGYPMNTTK